MHAAWLMQIIAKRMPDARQMQRFEGPKPARLWGLSLTNCHFKLAMEASGQPDAHEKTSQRDPRCIMAFATRGCTLMQAVVT